MCMIVGKLDRLVETDGFGAFSMYEKMPLVSSTLYNSDGEIHYAANTTITATTPAKRRNISSCISYLAIYKKQNTTQTR